MKQSLTDEKQIQADERWTLSDERWADSLRKARVTLRIMRGGSRLTGDGLCLSEGVCFKVVRGCLRLSDAARGVGGWTSLTRRLGGQECRVEWC